MPNPNQPKPKSTEDILREMESISDGDKNKSAANEGGGALKSLLGFFVKIAPDEDAPPNLSKTLMNAPPAPPAPRPAPRVQDLVAGEPAPKFAPPTPNAKAENLADKPFDEIYRAANLPLTPCTIDDLAQLLENPTIAQQPENVKVIAVTLTLSAKGITAEVPVADAVRRDRTLDAYQAMLAERVVTTEERNASHIQKISQEVEEFLKRKQAEMDALKAEISEAKKQAVEFTIRREIEEKRLADLIAPFLEGKPNPVTIGNQPEITPKG